LVESADKSYIQAIKPGHNHCLAWV